MTTANLISKTSASTNNIQNHLFWLFEQYQQTAKNEGAEAAIHLFFFADYCFSRVSSNQKKQLAENLLVFFLQKSAQLLKSVFKTEKANKIEFVFFLLEDNIINRSTIFDFLDFYENLEISAILPISLRILPLETEEEFIRTQKFTQLV